MKHNNLCHRSKLLETLLSCGKSVLLSVFMLHFCQGVLESLLGQRELEIVCTAAV
jgi:hypothetical protein